MARPRWSSAVVACPFGSIGVGTLKLVAKVFHHSALLPGSDGESSQEGAVEAVESWRSVMHPVQLIHQFIVVNGKVRSGNAIDVLAITSIEFRPAGW